MNVPIVEPEVKKDRIRLLVDYFTLNRNNHQVANNENFHLYKIKNSHFMKGWRQKPKLIKYFLQRLRHEPFTETIMTQQNIYSTFL